MVLFLCDTPESDRRACTGAKRKSHISAAQRGKKFMKKCSS